MKKHVLTQITADEAKRSHPLPFKAGMLDMDDVDPGDLDWYVDAKGHLWTNDALEGHGYTFYNLTENDYDGTDFRYITVK